MTEPFINDLEKMTDLLSFIVQHGWQRGYDAFLKSYSYLTANEVDNTVALISPESLADLLRQAENVYIEELNGRETGLAITSEQAKSAIIDFIYKFTPEHDQHIFEHAVESMGV